MPEHRARDLGQNGRPPSRSRWPGFLRWLQSDSGPHGGHPPAWSYERRLPTGRSEMRPVALTWATAPMWTEEEAGLAGVRAVSARVAPSLPGAWMTMAF